MRGGSELVTSDVHELGRSRPRASAAVAQAPDLGEWTPGCKFRPVKNGHVLHETSIQLPSSCTSATSLALATVRAMEPVRSMTTVLRTVTMVSTTHAVKRVSSSIV